MWHNKQLSGVDIGDIARIVVRRENSINRIKSIETKYYLMTKKWNFASLFGFLNILKTLKYCIATEDVATHIFSDYEKILKNMGDEISSDVCELLQMRIFKNLGSLNPDFFKDDKILHYMYEKISETPLERILKTQPLKDSHRNIIEKSNLFSFSTFL